MQRVVRLSFAGLLAFAGAGLTACGDKVTIPPQQVVVDSLVHSVTVSPPSASVAVGSSIQLAASVDAGPGIARTVTWSSSDNATATVDATGKVTGVKGGTATIIAKSTKDANVQGAAAITVTGGGVPTVTISSVNQTTAAGSVPANLSNAAGQLDITLNVDAAGQTITSVTALIKCGTDTLSASQAISNLAPAAAEASTVPVTLSINTAQFSSTTGVPRLHNGACTMSATAKTASGTQSATNNTPVTLNNADMVIVKAKNSGATATDATGAAWGAGDLTVTAIPVLYSNTTLATATLGFAGANPATQTVPVTGTAAAGFTASASWSASSGTAPTVKGLTLVTNPGNLPIVASANFVDSQGNAVTPAAVAAPISSPSLRLDNQAPTAAVPADFTANTQNTANGWVGKAFTFTKAITLNATTKADNLGVDKVTFTTQWAPTTTSTWTTFSDVNTIPETSTSTAYDLRIVTCDALNNCSNSAVITQFGVDVTAPTASTSTTAGAAPKANEIVGIGSTLSSATLAVLAGDPQGAGGVTGSGFGATPVLVTETRLFPNGATGQQSACVIGTAPATPDGTCATPSAQPLTFPVITTDPGQYALSYTVIDQAGNTAPAVASQYYIDNTAAPAISGGISIPASIVAGSAFSSSGVDNMDFASAQAFLHYPAAGLPAGLTGRIIFPATSTAAGVAFDNTLSRASSITATLGTQFYRSLNTISGGAIANPIVKPDLIGIRGVDAANNLSAPNTAALPAANIAAGTTLAIGTDLTDFTVSTSPAAVTISGTSTPKAFTLSAVVTATGPTAGTPFNSVCFYMQSPTGAENGQINKATGAAAGDLVLLNCTPTTVTTGPTPKLVTSTFVFTPTAVYAPAAGTVYNIYAVGVTANGDALLTATPAVITVNP